MECRLLASANSISIYFTFASELNSSNSYETTENSPTTCNYYFDNSMKSQNHMRTEQTEIKYWEDTPFWHSKNLSIKRKMKTKNIFGDTDKWKLFN